MSAIFGRSIISLEPSLHPTGNGGEKGGEREREEGEEEGELSSALYPRAQLSSDVERRAKGEESREERARKDT